MLLLLAIVNCTFWLLSKVAFTLNLQSTWHLLQAEDTLTWLLLQAEDTLTWHLLQAEDTH